VTAGYAGVRAKYSATFTDTFAAATESGSTVSFESGWTVGAGAEIRVAPHWSVQPEFLYADFGSIDAPASVLKTGVSSTWPQNPFTHSVDLTANVARVGVHYHF
jgi:opacity protein-like surface antigen